MFSDKFKHIIKILGGVILALGLIYILIKIALQYRRKNPNRLPTKRARINALKTKASKEEIKQWYRTAIEKIVTARLEAESSTTSGEPVFLSHYISKGRLRHWVLHVYGYKYDLRRVLSDGSCTRKSYKASISPSGFGLLEYQKSVSTHYSPTMDKYFYSMIGWTDLCKEEIDRKSDEVEKIFGSYALLTNNCHDFLQRLADEIITKRAPDWEWFRDHDVTRYQYVDQPGIGYDTISAATWSKHLTRSNHYVSAEERKKIDDLIAILDKLVDADLGREVWWGLRSIVLGINLVLTIVTSS
ncbi:hypothetical protein N7493_001597 [Penicillium malachiteum]|uniref:PPPDE domain-containing protein n=1 Tax=Penicillium malachiteum TaxID=1324776 RepID=A0AAD6HUH0_9EURO|nr:hypothetical protein N7493_001597 [Penicillium malachiteum]